MEDIENVELGDIITLDSDDVKFLDTVFKRPSNLLKAAGHFMEQHAAAAEEAWNIIRERWPIFEGYDFRVDKKDNCIIVLRKKQ